MQSNVGKVALMSRQVCMRMEAHLSACGNDAGWYYLLRTSEVTHTLILTIEGVGIRDPASTVVGWCDS